MEPTPRLTRWIEQAFAEADVAPALARLRALPAEAIGRQDPERVQAALVVRGGGDLAALDGMLELAARDWRDLLVAGGLAHADWPAVLDAVLGSPP